MPHLLPMVLNNQEKKLFFTKVNLFEPAAGIPVSVYKPSECTHQKSPVILVYFHGGGNTIGTRQTHESICKLISR